MSSHGVPRTEGGRSPEQLEKDLERIEKYRALDDELRQQVLATRFDSAAFELTSNLLRVNPEYYTVWNTRRRCLISGPLANPVSEPRLQTFSEDSVSGATAANGPSASPQDPGNEMPKQVASQRSTNENENSRDGNNSDTGKRPFEVIRDELAFTVPLLMKHPKCYWIWNYRMWTLEQATLQLPVVVSRSIWQEELGLVSKMLGRDRRNYHAWAYRRYVVSHLESSKLAGQSMAESEFAYTTKMIENDLSNFSAWHNRAQIIPKLLFERKADDASRKAFLDKEFSTIDNALNVGPEDQSLWYYHQYLMLNVAQQPDKTTIAPGFTIDDRAEIITREIEFIKDLLEDYKDVKWIFEMLLEYTLLVPKLREQPLGNVAREELEGWICNMKRLDPQRLNRWKELAEELQIPSE